MNKRYSKKREAIINCLKSTTEHPTAEWVYEKLKPEYPDLSLGTVYRNLKELTSNGEIIIVACVDGKERFDARTKEHAHVICEKCGKVADVFGIDIGNDVKFRVETESGFSVKYANLQFSGLCGDCKKEG